MQETCDTITLITVSNNLNSYFTACVVNADAQDAIKLSVISMNDESMELYSQMQDDALNLVYILTGLSGLIALIGVYCW